MQYDDMDQPSFKVILFLSNIGYIIGCLCLYLIAFWIVVGEIIEVLTSVGNRTFTLVYLLDQVGMIVFSIASFDVVKYLMIEEVLRGKEERSPQQARKTITKFGMIIATALSLEGLVLTIKVSKENIEKIGYPIALIFAAVLFIVGLGIFYKLTKDKEEENISTDGVKKID